MTNSIFNPAGPDTEHSGSAFSPARADDRSQMPADITDGKVAPDHAAELETFAGMDEAMARGDRSPEAPDLNPDYTDDRIWSDRVDPDKSRAL
ncbi:MAG TPA: hypothetical protein VEA69_11595 [Tepidisphaeraceae bacterium]|nr:hypothetical protein [Tepidisphaeraceae bacterium]